MDNVFPTLDEKRAAELAELQSNWVGRDMNNPDRDSFGSFEPGEDSEEVPVEEEEVPVGEEEVPRRGRLLSEFGL